MQIWLQPVRRRRRHESDDHVRQFTRRQKKVLAGIHCHPQKAPSK